MSRRPKKTDLTKLAKGMPCLIRVPSATQGHNPETTVACHVRMMGISGAGMKAPDLFIAFGCFECHQIVDGQQASEYTADQRRLMLLEGMVRTQQWLIDHGFISW